jgi:diguanylate cyclase (GGDEF)-like protein
MSQTIRKFSKPPIFENDGEKTRHAEILHYGSIALFTLLSVIFCFNLMFGSQSAILANWLLGTLILFQILVQWMIRAGHVNVASFLLLTLGWIVITGISYNVDGNKDEAIYGFVIVMFASGYLLGWRTAMVYTFASITVIWWLAYLETMDLILPIIDNPYLRALYLTVIFILILLIVYFLVKTITQALEQANRELSDRRLIELEREALISQLSEEITGRQRIQEKLQQLAITDPLTGLFNRRYFFEIAVKEFAKATRYKRPLSVAILDLDLFKNINDTYGHLVGDQALIQIGKLLNDEGRETDVMARYGGEEFVVLLPETDHENAMIVAERLRKSVAEKPIHIEDNTLNITVSIGVAGKYNGKNDDDFDRLILQADQALYKAKGDGRNRVVCYREDAEKPFA